MILARFGTLLAIVAAPLSADEAPLLPSWMAGCWEQQSGEGWTEECWTMPRAGIMLGSGRSGQGEALGSWEVMQIVRNPAEGTLTFYGAPAAANRTAFTARAGGEGVTFVNPAHDYPQRVHYRREGDDLVAEVSLLDGSNANRWTYRRAR